MEQTLNKFDEMVNIYALISPLDNKVFYVGATCQPVSKRLYQHCQETKHMPLQAQLIKHTIINEIISTGLKPEIVQLDEVELCESSFFEDFYTNLMRGFGFDIKPQKSKFEKHHLALKARYEYKKNTPPKFMTFKMESGEVVKYKYWK
jgi:hypothetical protein